MKPDRRARPLTGKRRVKQTTFDELGHVDVEMYSTGLDSNNFKEIEVRFATNKSSLAAPVIKSHTPAQLNLAEILETATMIHPPPKKQRKL